MRRTRMILAATALAAAGLATSGPATAVEEPPPGSATITQVRPVVLMKADGSGSVLFHYTCSSPDASGHLYVAVKQGPGISPENTSSSGAVSYSSTNWLIDQGANALVCDGEKHVIKASLQRDPWFSPMAPAVSAGTALVQICVTDSTGLSLDYSMLPVKMLG